MVVYSPGSAGVPPPPFPHRRSPVPPARPRPLCPHASTRPLPLSQAGGIRTEAEMPYCAGAEGARHCDPCMPRGYSVKYCGNHSVCARPRGAGGGSRGRSPVQWSEVVSGGGGGRTPPLPPARPQ